MYEVKGIDCVNAKVDTLTQMIESLIVTPAATVVVVTPNYGSCGTPRYNTAECLLFAGIPTDQVNYSQGNPYSNTYNPGWRNHPNFSYKSNNALFTPNPVDVVPPGYQKGAPTTPQSPGKSNVELLLENFIATQTQKNKEFANQHVHTNELMKQISSKLDVMDTYNKMLETQIS